jgi:hypothetical protein
MSIRTASSAIAAVLILLTGMVIGQLLAPRAAAPPASSTREHATELAAAAFYEALNSYLEQGDAAPLEDALAPGFVDHSELAPNQDAGALLRYLAAMRATYPDMRFEVTAMTPRDDQIAVAVAPTGGTAAIDGELIADWPPAAPGYEQLRIVDGKIAERWASETLPPQYEIVASEQVQHFSGWEVELVIEPIELAPGASETWRQYAPSILIAGAETIALEVEQNDAPDAPMLFSGQITSPTPLRRGIRIDLEIEAAVAFPDGESYRISNRGKEVATAYVVDLNLRPPEYASANAPNVWVGSDDASRENPTSGVLQMGTDPASAPAFALVRVTAAANETLPVRSISGLEQVLVVEGQIEADVHAGHADLLDRDDQGTVTPGDRLLLGPGDRLIAGAEAILSYRVTEAGPATVWIVTLMTNDG